MGWDLIMWKVKNYHAISLTWTFSKGKKFGGAGWNDVIRDFSWLKWMN